MLVQFVGGGHRRPFLVATATGEGDVQRVGGGTRVSGFQDVVFGVAVLALRGELIALGHGCAVGALAVGLPDRIVATGAINRCHRVRVLLARDLGLDMAGDAAVPGVDRFLEGGLVNVEADGLPVLLGGHGLIAVATEAVIIGEGKGAARRQAECEEQEEK